MNQDSRSTSRRTFLKGSSAALVGTVLSSRVGAQGATRPGRSRGDEMLRVALVGCGGRGGGAAAQALETEGSVELVAMADAFRDRLDSCHESLAERFGDRIQVPEENKYTGFDAYRKAIDSGADVVILATPPGFRPEHFEYAVEQGKHIFMEKPVAVDGPGVRQVLAAGKRAAESDLKIGVGLQRRHDPIYIEAVRRIHDGAIGQRSVAARLLELERSVGARAQGGDDRDGVPDAQLGTTSTGSAATTSSSSTFTTSTSATGSRVPTP